MAAKLVAEQGEIEGLTLSLEDAEEWVIGRDPDESTLIVGDPKVSRKHLLCRQVPEGIILTNLSQTNPMSINSNLIKGPYLLQEGDLIKIGDTAFRFHFKKDENREPQKETEENEDTEDELAENNTQNEPEKEPQEESPMPETLSLPETENTSIPITDEEPYYETIYEERTVTYGTPLTATIIPAEPAEEPPEAASENLANSGTETPIEEPKMAPDLCLKATAGPNEGLEIPLEQGKTYVIGSDPDSCDICFEDVSVSQNHAQLTLGEDNILSIKNLENQNGITIESEAVTTAATFSLNQTITLGTSSFIVIDKAEAESDAKSAAEEENEDSQEKDKNSLEEEDEKPIEEDEEEAKEEEGILPLLAAKQKLALDFAKAFLEKLPPINISTGQIAFLLIITGLVFIVGVGTLSLFKSEEVKVVRIIPAEEIERIIAPYTDVEYRFKANELFLQGHVLTKESKDDLMHRLQALPFVQKIDGTLIIDEFVWRETNKILAKNPGWRGISLHTPQAGRYIMVGYLKEKSAGDKLTDFINQQFAYVDRLENQVIVEEQILEEVQLSLLEEAFHDIFVEIIDGELTLSGFMASTQQPILQELITRFATIPGIKGVRNFVADLAPEESMINLSNRYRITGHFRRADIDVSVVINGRILARGDSLDGMTITSIKPDTIFLEKDGFKYKIDYNK